MSAEDFSVSLYTVEPHRFTTLHPPPPKPTMNTIRLPPSFMQALQNPLYTNTPLHPVTPEVIHNLFNNTNALQIENEAILAKRIKNYTKNEPTILGLIESKRNFR
jgi:hypothetical protein